MKIIFLDFDGVLLPLPADGHFEPNLPPSPEAISNLNLLVQVSGAKVVVTSSWRLTRSIRQLEDVLKDWGYRGSVFGKTQSADGNDDRGADVLGWLAHSVEQIESFVVIDDEPTDLASFARNLVMPSPQIGLQIHDVSEALRILDEVSA